MLNLLKEGIHYALFPYLGLPTAHTQLTQNGGQGRRPTPTTNPRGNNALLPLHTTLTDLGGHSQNSKPRIDARTTYRGREP